jgi:hypothetical protein
VQGWVNGAVANNGVLLEQDAAPLVNGLPTQTQFGRGISRIVAQRPALSICFKVNCAASAADCDGNAPTGARRT